MAIRLLFTVETNEDVDEAFRWYEKRRPGLGDELLLAIADTLRLITKHPELCPIIEDGYRQARVKRFPYTVIYDVESDHLTVYAAAHTARDPASWRRRLP